MNKQVVLSLGGNVGNVQETFTSAINSIEKKVGKLIKSSSLYITNAWGVENQPDFLNQILIFETDENPHSVLRKCLRIEKKLGRKRLKGSKWQKRKLDIDILFYEEEIINSLDLIVPHPYLHQRNFVLSPLAEIIPEFVHPILGKKMIDLKNECNDKKKAIKLLD
jgi:2-amino-4-hydroxy-6-hydroxymethyldihydropteridine diphosphokinase